LKGFQKKEEYSMFSEEDGIGCPNCSGRTFVRDDNGSADLASVPGMVMVRCTECGLKMTKNELFGLRGKRFRLMRDRLNEDSLREKMKDRFKNR
jgi:hypothetical protein